MNLYQVNVLDDMDEITFLTVSDKSEDELKQEVENDDSYSCLMWVSVRQIQEVDGYKIVVGDKTNKIGD